MPKDNVYTQLYMVIKDVELACASLTADIVQAFHSGNYEEVDRLNNIGRQLKSYCDEVRLLQTKWAHDFEESVRIRARYNPINGDDQATISDSSNNSRSITSTPTNTGVITITPHDKDDKTNLRVTLPSGRIINNQFAAQTFVETIQVLGVEKIKLLGIKMNNHPLISTDKHERYSQHRLGGYFIMTHSSTKYKKDLLEDSPYAPANRIVCYTLLYDRRRDSRHLQ